MPDFRAYRVAEWDTPLRANDNRSPGRFNRADSPATQYLALHPLTPWAEYARYHGLTTIEQFRQRRLTGWVLRIDGDPPTIDFNAASQWGISPEDLVADDWTECQDLADRLRAAGNQAAIVPSAALPGTRNLVIFGPRVQIPYLWTPIDDGDIPVGITAASGSPPEELLPLVRYRGRQQHAELDAWKVGQTYLFADLRTAP